MRKFAVGLAFIALLAAAGESDAYPNGTADVLGLISSAVIQPYWRTNGDFTLVEVTSPVWFNENLHGFWFDAACVRGNSFTFPLTRNDITVVESLPDPTSFTSGLLLITRSLNFDNPLPFEVPLHARGHWISLTGDFVRSVDPIAVTSAETLDRYGHQQTYSPLRSAASFTNPEHSALTALTTIYLVCPTSNVYTFLSESLGFPKAPASTSGVVAVIFNNEEPYVDVEIACKCLTPKVVTTIDPVYGTTPDDQESSVVPLWYTEMYAYDPGFFRKVVMNGEATLSEAEAEEALVQVKDPVKAFTGYRAIQWFDTPFGTPASGLDKQKEK
jgi:hypothetical protein